MPGDLTIYSYVGSTRTAKALIAAQYNGIEINQPKFEMGKDNKTAEFKAKSPMGKVPVLETREGCLFESNSIARYVAKLRGDTQLFGCGSFQAAQVESWIDFLTNEVDVPATVWVYPVIGVMPFNYQATAQAKKDLKAALSLLDAHLATRTYMVGDSITLADVTGVCALVQAFKLVCDAKFRPENVERWFVTCVNQPEFAAVLGEVVLCEKEKEAPKPAGKKKEKKPKQQQQPKKEKKKEEKPKEEKPKAASPLDVLKGMGRSPMILDEWKRTYSNSKDLYGQGMTDFYSQLDREGYSVYFCNYNYNDDNKVLFMTCNLAGGFIQRCDEMRKYAFGTIQIIGTNEQQEMVGAFLLRGAGDEGVKALLEVNPDAEYWTWTKANLDDAADKAKLADMWCAENSIDGKEVLDFKCFK